MCYWTAETILLQRIRFRLKVLEAGRVVTRCEQNGVDNKFVQKVLHKSTHSRLFHEPTAGLKVILPNLKASMQTKRFPLTKNPTLPFALRGLVAYCRMELQYILDPYAWDLPRHSQL